MEEATAAVDAATVKEADVVVEQATATAVPVPGAHPKPDYVLHWAQTFSTTATRPQQTKCEPPGRSLYDTLASHMTKRSAKSSKTRSP
jgi:hypothetical protein